MFKYTHRLLNILLGMKESEKGMRSYWLPPHSLSEEELRDFSQSLDDLDPTVCALCGKSAECKCLVHPIHDCKETRCACGDGCPCCSIRLCSCEVDDG